jgi:hypothetical protein
MTENERFRPITGYKVLRDDRAAFGCPAPGAIVYHAKESYGCASEDTRREQIEYTACSVNPSGIPFFTIPREDLEPVYE